MMVSMDTLMCSFNSQEKEGIMSRITIMDVSKAMYQVLHDIALTAEAGKPISTNQLEDAQQVLNHADRISAIRETVYAAA